MTRFEYLTEHTDGIVLGKTETRDFLEVVMDRYGDVIRYRVYGDEKSGFSLVVK